MRLEHQIKNVVNRVDEKKSDFTPGQKTGNQEHPISKKTSDYEEKFFTIPGGEGKDDRDKFITGNKPEHPENVEDTEGHENPTKKTHKKGETKPEEEVEPAKEDMNIDLKQVENLQEKKKIENEDFMAKIAHAAKKGKKEVKIGDKTHKVTMDKDTAHKIASEIETKESMNWADAVKLATDTRVQTAREYWEDAIQKR